MQGQGVIEKDSEKDELTQPSSASNTKQAKTAPKKKQNTNEKVSKFEWPDNLVESLINAWQDQPVLYDVSHPEYHLKDKRRNAIQRIVSALEDLEVNPMPSHDEVTKKISSLRGYFVSEKNKVNQAKVSGAGANEAYKSKWQFFESLQFLSDNIIPRRTESNLVKRKKEVEDDDKDFTYPIDNTPSSKSAKKMEARRTNDLIETAINALNRPKQAVAKGAETEVRSADKIFGEMVWRMLVF